MKQDDSAADELAHERFRLGFDKLFGSTPALRKQQALDAKADEALSTIERALERMIAPIRKARQAELARVTEENRRLRDAFDAIKAAVGDIGAEVAAIAKLRGGAAGDDLAKGASPQGRSSIVSHFEKIDQALRVAHRALMTAGVKSGGVAKSGETPFVALPSLDLDRPMMRVATERMGEAWSAIFAEQRDRARDALATVSKAEAIADDDDQINQEVETIISGLSLALTAAQILELAHILGSVALDAAARTYRQVTGSGLGNASEGEAPRAEAVGSDAFQDLTQRALTWAKAHAEELVDEINANTREGVREAISEGLSDGMTRAELADLISGLGAFSETRVSNDRRDRNRRRQRRGCRDVAGEGSRGRT